MTLMSLYDVCVLPKFYNLTHTIHIIIIKTETNRRQNKVKQ